MNKLLFALLLLTAGGVLLYLGYERRESLAGAAETFGHEIASAFDGEPRVAEHTWYFAGGGALVVAGLAVLLRR
jgi:hypothetical protein